MTQKRILTIEDDAAIRRGIVDALRFSGYDAVEASTGPLGLETAVKLDLDLILLDMVLPGLSGIEILKSVRQARPSLPVIVLTARGEEDHRVEGLKHGADDYVVKPFSVRELLARIEAVLRRSPARPENIENVHVPGGTADFARRELQFADGSRAELSERESELLRYFASNSGRAISRDEILANVWRITPDNVNTRTIDMHIARLREKLRDDPSSPTVIVTVRGKGYMFGQFAEQPDGKDFV